MGNTTVLPPLPDPHMAQERAVPRPGSWVKVVVEGTTTERDALRCNDCFSRYVVSSRSTSIGVDRQKTEAAVSWLANHKHVNEEFIDIAGAAETGADGFVPAGDYFIISRSNFEELITGFEELTNILRDQMTDQTVVIDGVDDREDA